MKLRMASLTILCLVLAAVPAPAQYNNGPINGTTDAWTINFGYVVSDTFTGISFASQFQFGVWEFPGDVMSSVDWSITSAENGGTTYGFGTVQTSDQFISSNQYGYDIDKITANVNVSLNYNSTYWLNLQNAVVPSGDPVYWDENSGASSASESAVGTIPSEAFTISGGCGARSSSPDCGAPEPGSILLFGSGVLALAGLRRGKLNL